ncbi:MAG TPA: murein biosynthesis integral membrane protein MurJ [Acidobacteriota bacterium]|jgi:putative peptidoglycan lipid II flippase|nr:murein biosynthesis integral membrane protein MurJ [Acidobacteriota bacterium]
MSSSIDKAATPADLGAEVTKDASPNLVRSASQVSVSVMASRVLGLVREQVFAALFGAGFEYDAFITAFRIPNLLRDLFAEGALSSAFVTTFSQYLTTKGRQEAFRLSNLVATALMLTLGAITILGIIFAPQLVDLVAYGFAAQPGKKELTVELTRVMMPFILLVALAAKAMGILNACDRFAIPAIASAFFNIGSIVGGLLCAFVIGPYVGLRPIVGMAIGTLIGGGLQFAVQWPSLRTAGFRYRPMLSFTDPGVRQIIRLMGPAVIGTAAVQVNVLVNSNFASTIVDAAGRHLDGPVSWLSYAFRLMQFPIGVFGVAIGTVTLPAISRSVARNNIAEFRETLSRSLGLVFLLCVPSAAGLAVLGSPIIAAIYQHGKFSALDTAQTAAALKFYAVGLAGYAAIKVLAPAFYALDDARTPMLISLALIATNVALNWAFLRVLHFGHRGLALSTSIVALLNFAILLSLMRRRIGRIEGRRLLTSLGKISAASGLMALTCWTVSHLVARMAGSAGSFASIVNVGVAVPIGVIVLYASCRILRVQELDLLVEALARRMGRRS